MAELAGDSQGSRLPGDAFGQRSVTVASKELPLHALVCSEMGISLSSPSWLQTCDPLVSAS